MPYGQAMTQLGVLMILPGLLGIALGSTACSSDSPEPGTDAGIGGGGGAPSTGGRPGDDAGSGVGGSESIDGGGRCEDGRHVPGGEDSWGGCWPGALNTGVPRGTELGKYTGPCVITVDGTVIDAKAVDCDLQIRAAGVRILRSRITGSVSTDEDSTGFSFEISDSEVDAGQRAATGIGAVDFAATRVHVVGGNRSIHCWHDCTVTDSYVHGQFRDPTGTFHESGMRMGQSAVFRHNTVVCDAPDVPPDGGCSADLTGYGDFGPVQNNTIDRNLFGATTGGYCTYGGSTTGKPYSGATHHIVFTDNVWQRGTRQSDHGTYVCGYYGSNTSFDPDRPGNVWTNNTFDDGARVESAN